MLLASPSFLSLYLRIYQCSTTPLRGRWWELYRNLTEEDVPIVRNLIAYQDKSPVTPRRGFDHRVCPNVGSINILIGQIPTLPHPPCPTIARGLVRHNNGRCITPSPSVHRNFVYPKVVILVNKTVTLIHPCDLSHATGFLTTRN